MVNRPWFTANIHSPRIGVALLAIAITLIPIAGVALGQLICFSSSLKGEIGSKPWSQERVHYCNGG
ncbi:hypothetical protein [Synechococcus sp. M16CYN]|uniref:hypothetical protein n=1 Tax=Synechococcus sp. M16CYN TaxID=3103139 RepID=UPI0030DEACBF